MIMTSYYVQKQSHLHIAYVYIRTLYSHMSYQISYGHDIIICDSILPDCRRDEILLSHIDSHHTIVLCTYYLQTASSASCLTEDESAERSKILRSFPTVWTKTGLDVPFHPEHCNYPWQWGLIPIASMGRLYIYLHENHKSQPFMYR